MSISYPITLPPRPGARRLSLIGSSSSAMTASPWTASQQVQENQAQLWRGSLELPPMNAMMAREWFGKLLSLRVIRGTFYWADPLWKTPQGSWAGAPVIDTAGQSGNVVALTGFTPGAIGKTGDYVQIGSGANAHLHIVTQDFLADGSGNANVDIFPALRQAPASGEAVVTTKPQGIFRLA